TADWICVDIQHKHFDCITDLSISRALCVACSKDGTVSIWDLRPMIDSPLVVSQHNQDQQEKAVLLCKIEDQSAARAMVSPFVTGVRGLPLLIGSIIYDTEELEFRVEDDEISVDAINDDVLMSSEKLDVDDDRKLESHSNSNSSSSSSSDSNSNSNSDAEGDDDDDNDDEDQESLSEDEPANNNMPGIPSTTMLRRKHSSTSLPATLKMYKQRTQRKAPSKCADPLKQHPMEALRTIAPKTQSVLPDHIHNNNNNNNNNSNNNGNYLHQHILQNYNHNHNRYHNRKYPHTQKAKSYYHVKRTVRYNTLTRSKGITSWEREEKESYPVVKINPFARSRHIQTLGIGRFAKRHRLADNITSDQTFGEQYSTISQQFSDVSTVSAPSEWWCNKRRFRSNKKTEELLDKDPGVVCMDILDLVRNGFTNTTMRETKIRLAGGNKSNLEIDPAHSEGYQFDVDKIQNEKYEKEIRDTIKGIEKRQIEGTQGWYHMWDKGSFLFASIHALAQPVIDNLISDDQRYVRVFDELSDREQMYLAQLKEHCHRIMRGKSHSQNNLKQNENDIYKLLQCAYLAHQKLHTIVRFVAKNYRVRGQYEGDPGVKHVQRIIEKGLLEYIGHCDKKRYSDSSATSYNIDNLFAPENVKIDYASVKDYARAGITCQGVQQMIEALRLIEKNPDIEIVRIKNRFDSSHKGGYKDILINIRFLDRRQQSSRRKKSSLEEDKHFKYRYGGHICELQLHHEKYQIIRSEMKGHDNYTASRFMIDFVRQKAHYCINETDEGKLQLIKLVQKLQ
ncbi:hypothetical protein RFI_19972, partial [Reticulomyxa filosa]